MDEQPQPALRRTLTLPAVVISGIGVILGAGVYALIGEAAALSGNALWLSFLLSATIAAFTGLSYMELSSMFPEASAEYEYTTRSFGPTLAFMVGVMVILSGILGAATVGLGFAGYLSGFIGTPLIPVAFLLLLLLTGILIYGIKQSIVVAAICTLIEAGGIVGIIIIGLPHLGSVDYFVMPLGLAGVFQASALIFFAYQGFEEIVKLSDETLTPEKNIPRGLMIAVIITTLLYIAVSVSVVSISGYETIAGSSNPFAKVAGMVFPGGVAVFTAIALFATANTVLLMMLSASRIMYGMTKKGKMPAFIGYVNPKTRTPVIAVLVVFLLSALFLFTGSIRDIAYITNITLFVTFAVINATVITLRTTMPDQKRPFQVPGRPYRMPVIPVLGIISCLFFLFQLELTLLLFGAAIIGATLVAAHILEQRSL